MLRNQNGISVYTVLSVILFVALVFILAIPNFYNLDKNKNVDDCLNNMKTIWVGTTDYMKDQKADFNGDLSVLRRTKKASDPKVTYLQTETYCPETARQKDSYIVYGKYIADKTGTEIKTNVGVIIYCPNLGTFPKHYIPKNFYENMDPAPLQNMMAEDLDVIDQETKSNGKRKVEMIEKYINIWKTMPEAYELRKADANSLRAMLFPDKYKPVEAEQDTF